MSKFDTETIIQAMTPDELERYEAAVVKIDTCKKQIRNIEIALGPWEQRLKLLESQRPGKEERQLDRLGVTRKWDNKHRRAQEFVKENTDTLMSLKQFLPGTEATVSMHIGRVEKRLQQKQVETKEREALAREIVKQMRQFDAGEFAKIQEG